MGWEKGGGGSSDLVQLEGCKTIQIPSPPPGADWDYSPFVPGEFWEILAVNFSFTADGSPDSRIIGISWGNPDAETGSLEYIVGQIYFPGAVATDTSLGFTAATGIANQNTVLDSTPIWQTIGLPNPPIVLQPSVDQLSFIGSTGGTYGAGDQYDNIILTYRATES